MHRVQVRRQAVFKLKGPASHSGHGLPVKKKVMAEKKTKLKNERELTSGSSYAGVASAMPAQTTMIQLSGGMDQNMLACMLHAHLVNMGSPGAYQATLDQLFAANGLTPIIVPTSSRLGKYFGILPGMNTPENFPINTNINKEAKTSVMEVVEKEAVMPPTGTREKILTRDPRKLKSRRKELSRLCREVPEFKEGLA